MKNTIKLSIACATILLTSCGDSSSESAPVTANSLISLFSIDELNQFSCNKAQENTVVYIEEDDSYCTCTKEGDSWKWVSDKSSSSNATEPSSSSIKQKSSSSSQPNSSANTSSSSSVKSSSSVLTSSSSSDKSSSSTLTSSSSSVSSSSFAPVDPLIPRFGILKDSRDGQYYKIVTIANQTWMAQNLNYNYVAKYAQTDIIQPSNWCAGIDDQERKNGDCAKFGRLYTYAAAFDSSKILNTKEPQGICPDGWHIPSYNEWMTLVKTANVEGDTTDLFHPIQFSYLHLLDGSGSWGFAGGVPLDNSFGFKAIPSGETRQGSATSYLNAAYWGQPKEKSYTYTVIGMEVKNISFYAYTDLVGIAAAIRCVKDEVETDPVNLSTNVIEPPAYNIDLGPVIKEPINQPAETYLNKKITYGEFTDKRDGQVYKTVVIGEQTWMAQNLNYKIKPGIQSWCGGGTGRKEGNCDTYGRLYTWAGMKNRSESECGYGYICNDSATQGICPDGWEIPSVEQFDTLSTYIATITKIAPGDALKANSDLWYEYGKGSDFVGFSALPAGLNHNTFESVNDITSFWTHVERGDNFGIVASLRARYDRLLIDSSATKDEAYSIRCIKK